MLTNLAIPQPVTDVYAVTSPVVAYEDESTVIVVLQIPLNAYSLILIESLDEIKKVLLTADRTL